MKIQGVFEAALLKYIQQNVDQLAEGIHSYEHDHSSCLGHDADDYCYCDTSIKMAIQYRVSREASRLGYYEWKYDGDFVALINMLDRMEDADG